MPTNLQMLTQTYRIEGVGMLPTSHPAMIEFEVRQAREAPGYTIEPSAHYSFTLV